VTDAALILTDLKYADNLNAALRAAANFAASRVFWTGTRVLDAAKHPRPRRGRGRMGAEAGFDDFGDVRYERAREPLALVNKLAAEGYTPVAVELVKNSTSLERFTHPDKAVYIFGPEDGDLSTELLKRCTYAIRIPSHGCLNVATAAAVVLSHREMQRLSKPRLKLAR
jgi:tRNA G18 (ribose-2'-O)-methylase SpoU